MVFKSKNGVGGSLKKRKANKEPKDADSKKSLDDNIKNYFRGAYSELRKVSWPSRKLSWNLTFSVIIFVGLFGLFTTLVDFGILQALEKFILKGK